MGSLIGCSRKVRCGPPDWLCALTHKVPFLATDADKPLTFVGKSDTTEVDVSDGLAFLPVGEGQGLILRVPEVTVTTTALGAGARPQLLLWQHCAHKHEE